MAGLSGMQNVRQIIGTLIGMKDGKLEISFGGVPNNELVIPGFDITPEIISDWIGKRDVRVVLIDDIAVQIKQSGGIGRPEIRYPRDL